MDSVIFSSLHGLFHLVIMGNNHLIMDVTVTSEACLVKDEPVLGRPPPLRDKKFEQSNVAMEKKPNMFLKAFHVVLNLEDKVLWRVEY